MEIQNYRTWIVISAKNLKNNYQIFRKLIDRKVLLMGVIKSNAYGHGLMTMARAYSQLGVDWIGVDSIAEANKLRKEKIKQPLFVLGYTQAENFSLATKQNISLSISSFDSLQKLSRYKKKLNIHIKINSGMNRQGFFLSDVPEVLMLLHTMRNITVEGLYTHFAAAKDPKDVTDTQKQIDIFKKAIHLFRAAGFKPICHAAASGGVMNFPQSHFDMVRVGIGMYGLWPSPETKKAFQKTIRLQPVLSWLTIVSELKWLEKGQKIGYDYTERLGKRTKVAILPIGYWHGYWRAFSGKAYVLIGGKRCKVLGRVSMDMIAVDVTEVPNVKVEEEAVLLGKQGREEVTADELAKLAKTSNYEIVTRLNPLIKKIFR